MIDLNEIQQGKAPAMPQYQPVQTHISPVVWVFQNDPLQQVCGKNKSKTTV
jgi:hypothetical protein